MTTTFEVPVEYRDTAVEALQAYVIIQQQGQQTRRIGQATARKETEVAERAVVNMGHWLEDDEIDVLVAALTEYVRLQVELATVRRIPAAARERLTHKSKDLLVLLQEVQGTTES